MQKITNEEIKNYKYYHTKDEALRSKNANNNQISYNTTLLKQMTESLKEMRKFKSEEDETNFYKRMNEINGKIISYEKSNLLIFKAYGI